ncbi:uncharacterized protein LOC117106851 [Anneissia japonica]|uniref:uncharacterized protein LOC117106851 n=1 Tax=Anneissia japonica TaxID=1529436 RepID=UPI0014256987|nr:uncharacterized protein LOC117106851 [Anneissia japonica]
MPRSYRMAEMDRIVWSKRAYMLDELLSSHRFPLIVQVVRGHYGSEDTDSLGMGQILRIHRKQRRKRVIAVEDGRGRRLSIPRDFNIPFERLPVKRETRGQLLDEILCDHQLPIKVQFSRQAKLDYYVDSDVMVDENFGTLTIEHIYDEMTLQGNAINFGVLDYAIIDIPAYLKLEFSKAEGILGAKDQSTFKSLCESLDAIVESEINYEGAPGNQNIPLYYPRKDNTNLNIESTIMPDKTLSIQVCDSNSVHDFADNTTTEKELSIPNLKTLIDGSWKENADKDESYSAGYIPKHFSSPRPMYMQDNFVLMSDSKVHNCLENYENKLENTNSSSSSNSTLPHRSRSSSTSSSTTLVSKATDKKLFYKKASRRTSVPHRFKYDKKEALQGDDEDYTSDPERYHNKQSAAAEDDRPIFPGLFKSSGLMKMNKEAFKVDTSNSQTSNEGVFTPTTEYELNEKGKKVKMKKKKEKTKGKIKKEKRISKIQDLPKSLEAMNVNQVIDMLTILKLGSYSPTVAIEGIDGTKLKAMRTTEFETKIGMNAQDANKLAAFCLERF